MSNLPLVSIIINCHNGEKYLKECLDSVILQTYKNWEIIFWDNLSFDNSKNLIKEYSNNQIKYFKSENFLKLYEARNSAIKKSSGKYICFLDTDDYWDLKKIELQVEFLENNKNFDMVYSNFFNFNQITGEKNIQNNFNLPHGKITDKILKNYTVGILTTCIRKSIFDKRVFNKKYEIIGDFDFFIKLSTEINIGCIQQPLAVYRIHANNYSKRKRNIYIQELNEWINENEKFFSKAGYSLISQKILLLKLKIKKIFNLSGV